MVQLFCVYATAQVNSRKYLAMSQIRSHYSKSNTYFDLIEEKGFGLVWSLIQGLLHEWLILQEQIKPQTHMVRKLPIVQENPLRFQLTSCVPDLWILLVT